MYLNKAYIIGNLTRDPELRALPSGIKVCSFSVATNRVFKDKDGQRQEAADYHNIVAFSKLGELAAQYLKKGQQALIEGRMQTRSWEQNGEKKYRTEIVADNIQFGSKGNGGSGSSAERSEPVSKKASAEDKNSGEAIEYPTEEINPNDIPF